MVSTINIVTCWIQLLSAICLGNMALFWPVGGANFCLLIPSFIEVLVHHFIRLIKYFKKKRVHLGFISECPLDIINVLIAKR